MKSILIPVMGFGQSGGMRVLSKLADQFLKKGYEVDFIAPSYANKPYYPTEANVVTLAVNEKSKLKLLVYIVKFIIWMVKKGDGYQIGLANFWMTAYILKIGGIFSKIDCFYYIQAYEPEFYDESKGFKYRVLKFFARHSYKLGLKHVVNADLYRSYKEISTEYVVEPGLDVDIFRIKNKEKQNDAIIVGCIGRKEVWKGTKKIFDAVSLVASEINQKIIFNVAFNAPSEVSFCKNVDFNLLSPHGDLELSRFYNKVDIFIATGEIQSGAFHYPCMEALACGKIVITNYSPGTKENSIYIDDVSVDSIASALKFAILNPVSQNNDLLRISNEIRNDYSWDRVSNKMIRIFEEQGFRSISI